MFSVQCLQIPETIVARTTLLGRRSVFKPVTGQLINSINTPKHRRQFDVYWPYQYVTPAISERNSSNYSYPYDPTVGYEPYWPHPQWVLNESRLPMQNENCFYYSCNKIFIMWGKVCGRSYQTWEERTFDNYCDLMKHDCANPKEKWRIIELEHCTPPLVTLNPTFHEKANYSAMSYMMGWLASSPTTRINSRVTVTRRRRGK